MTKVKMGQTGTSPASWPLYAAQDRGFFREQGLEIESIVLSSSVTQTQALITGDMNFNTYSVDSVAKPVLAGASLKMIGSAQEVPNFQMIVASDVRSFADLRGKTVAAGSAGGYFDIVMRGMLSANGLKPTDYEVISIGSSADRLPALQAGRIQGMIAGGPDDSKALAAGLKSLGYVNEYLKDLQYNGYAVEQGWARANEPTVIAFLKAMINATNWLVEPANKADAIRIYRDVSKLDDAFLETIYQQMVVQKMLSRDLRINLKGTQNVLDLAVQQGSLEKVPPLDTWIDMSYLDKAQRA